ncbi:class I SAM-dependent methyltransferase [Rhizobium mongolense]|uniref:class I SAM-dependent methyltransferase n=1 Tax=Rhizobium mongolense TaxID=57676 RepID=UPI003555CB4C
MDDCADIPRKDYLGTVADLYEQNRPRYPPDVVTTILLSLQEDPIDATIADVGCGTGIFTRQLARHVEHSCRVVGVEPNTSMREQARVATAAGSGIEYKAGTAEHMPFHDGECLVITAATAASWFDRPRFYHEVVRVIRPNGVLALVQNRRAFWASESLAALESLLEEATPSYRRGTHYDPAGGFRGVDYASELAASPEFGPVIGRTWEWKQKMSASQFIGLCLSLSVAQEGIRGIGQRAFMDKLDELTQRFCDAGGAMEVPFVTELTLTTVRSKTSAIGSALEKIVGCSKRELD